jgi:hypothetical protein
MQQVLYFPKKNLQKFITIIFLVQLMTADSVLAQLMTNNNIGITIAGASLTVKGDVLNNNGTTIDNTGTIDLSGNWIHNAANNCFLTSAGTVIMNGANQTIGGTSSTVFNNLTLLGSGTKTLLLNTTVGGAYANPAGTLDVGTVAMDLNSNTLTVSNAASSGITATTGYVLSEQTDNSSKVKWTIGSNTSAHTIPFGKSTGVLIPLTFYQTSGNAGELTVSTYTTLADNTPYPVAPASVTNITYLGNGDYNSAVDRYWSVETMNPCTANINFSFDPTESPIVGTGAIYAQYYDDAADVWLPPLPTQSNPTASSIMMNYNSDFGTFGAARGASPLPINLLSFDAKANKQKQVDVYWQTAAEIDNDYFTVERSKDGIHFETVTIVKGAGNSTMQRNYQALDENPWRGISYYRLKQTDYDGKFNYTGSVSVIIKDGSGIDFVAYPNPANDVLNIISTGSTGSEAELTIYDAMNKMVMQKKMNTETLNQVDVSNLAEGVYTCSLNAGDEVEIIRIVVAR